MTFLDGTTPLGTVDLNGGAATLTTSLDAGNHSITAVYGGSGTFAGSSSDPLSQSVGQAASATQLDSDGSPALFGQPVTLTATVSGQSPATGLPLGSVTFWEGTTNLGSADLTLTSVPGPGGVGSLASATATLTLAGVSQLALGDHTIIAIYNGDDARGDFTGSTSPPITQSVVSQLGTTTAVTSSRNPAHPGDQVTLTATIAAVAPTAVGPTGTVTFMDGANSLGTADVANGVATLTTTFADLGDHTITAIYGGDASFTGSTSPPLTQTITSPSQLPQPVITASAFSQGPGFAFVQVFVQPTAGGADRPRRGPDAHGDGDRIRFHRRRAACAPGHPRPERPCVCHTPECTAGRQNVSCLLQRRRQLCPRQHACLARRRRGSLDALTPRWLGPLIS